MPPCRCRAALACCACPVRHYGSASKVRPCRRAPTARSITTATTTSISRSKPRSCARHRSVVECTCRSKSIHAPRENQGWRLQRLSETGIFAATLWPKWFGKSHRSEPPTGPGRKLQHRPASVTPFSLALRDRQYPRRRRYSATKTDHASVDLLVC